MFLSLLISIQISSSFSQDLEEKNPMQVMLEKNTEILTKQYDVIIRGVPYQKLEANGEIFYFKALQRKDEVPMAFCQRPEGWRSEQLVEMSLKVFKRKLFFVSALQENCTSRIRGERDNLEEETNNKNSKLLLNPTIGIYLPEEEDDVIKNKKLLIPIGGHQGGLSGEVNWEDGLFNSLPF